MPFWLKLEFQDANNPLMEQMLFFHDLLMTVLLLIVITIVLIIVLSLNMNYSNTAWSDNSNMELLWTVFPILILFVILVPSTQILYLTEEPKDSLLSLKITGHQWYWSYEISDFSSLKFDSFMVPYSETAPFRLLEVDNRIPLPFKTYIQVMITSTDVIHSWTVPSLAVKMDAVPGRLNRFNLYSEQSGLLWGQCSEICGINHSFMPISLEFINMKSFIKMF
uniref:Cytochrome c oxidase subunit 2 n=1 Tax=Arctotanais alascensis TaxID=1003057 RepID=A0A810VUM4_9CRUS|nr:cytochrome c oxidase subunit 2 [Arctotanais alascensis]